MSRHWQRFANSLGLIGENINGGLSLKCFLVFDNQSLQEAVSGILSEVASERDIELMLTRVAESWEEHKFTFERWSASTAVKAAASIPNNNGGVGAPDAAAVFAQGGSNHDPKSSVLIIIAGLSDILAKVDDDYLILSKALESHSSEYYATELKKEKDTLCVISDVLNFWRDVQEDLITLGRLLLGSSFPSTTKSAKEPLLKTNFDLGFKQYSKLMSDVIKKPMIKQCCLNQGLDIRGALLHYKNLFNQQRLELSKLIQGKQRLLPRLNFLSLHEMLIILGGWHGNEVKFQRAAINLFGRGVSRICVEGARQQVMVGNDSKPNVGEDVIICGLETHDGNAIDLRKNVVLGGASGHQFPDGQSECGKGSSADDEHKKDNDVDEEVGDDGIEEVPPATNSNFDIGTCGGIEGSLSLIISESQGTVARILANAQRVSATIPNYTLNHYLENIEQVSATEFELMWTREFSEALQSNTECRREYLRLHRVFDDLAKSLITLISSGDNINYADKTIVSNNKAASYTNSTYAIRSRTKNLFTLAIEKKNICRDFLREMVTTVDDFNWQSLLRTSLDTENESSIFLTQGRAKLYYGNEFHSAFLG